jgi:hypothetical protein
VSDSWTANLAVSSNVYFLPVTALAAEPVSRPTRWTRLSRTWWRVRFALAGLRLAFKPEPTPLFAEDDMLAELQGRAEFIDRRQRHAAPAPVIDFVAARARLRPAPAQ